GVHLQRMSHLRQCVECAGGNARLDHDSAAELLAIGKTRFLHRSLDIHMIVDDVRHELCMSQRLIQPAHDAEADVLVTSLHECGNDGVEGALAASECIWRCSIEREEASAIL